MKPRRKPSAMQMAHTMRHRDSSDESPAMETGASDAPRGFNVMETGASDAPSRFAKRIVADHRESRSGVPAALATHPNVDLTIRRLKLGDYRVNDTLIVERKTLADFAWSQRSEIDPPNG